MRAKEFMNETTVAGGIATVAMPLMSANKRPLTAVDTKYSTRKKNKVKKNARG